MNKIVQRLLIFFVGIPVVIGIVYFNILNHLPLHIAIWIFSCIALIELHTLFSKNSPMLPKPLVVTLGVSIPVSAYVFIRCGITTEYTNFVLLAAALILMGYEVISAKTFEHSNTSLALSLFVVFYGGYLITFISRMTAWQNSVYFIAVFLFMVFMCDSIAWLFGMLLGKNNRGVVAASPNKSIAGFIGGYIGTVLASILAHFLWPQVFCGSVIKSVILGLLIATSAIIGDLVESVFKRSSGCKDSGTIMPGRGGVLDSIDSILFSAPVYFIVVHFFYNTALLGQ